LGIRTVFVGTGLTVRAFKDKTVERLAAAFGLETWELLAPELPKRARRLRREAYPSNVHYKRRRGPYARTDAGGISDETGREGAPPQAFGKDGRP
jgi:hypothetical protein